MKCTNCGVELVGVIAQKKCPNCGFDKEKGIVDVAYLKRKEEIKKEGAIDHSKKFSTTGRFTLNGKEIAGCYIEITNDGYLIVTKKNDPSTKALIGRAVVQSAFGLIGAWTMDAITAQDRIEELARLRLNTIEGLEFDESQKISTVKIYVTFSGVGTVSFQCFENNEKLLNALLNEIKLISK